MTTLYRSTSRVQIHSETTDFGMIDNKGRALGYEIRVYENTWEKAPEGACGGCIETPRFTAYTSTVRGGETFGASHRDIGAETLAETLKLAQALQADALKRLAKKFAQA